MGEELAPRPTCGVDQLHPWFGANKDSSFGGCAAVVRRQRTVPGRHFNIYFILNSKIRTLKERGRVVLVFVSSVAAHLSEVMLRRRFRRICALQTYARRGTRLFLASNSRKTKKNVLWYFKSGDSSEGPQHFIQQALGPRTIKRSNIPRERHGWSNWCYKSHVNCCEINGVQRYDRKVTVWFAGLNYSIEICICWSIVYNKLIMIPKEFSAHLHGTIARYTEISFLRPFIDSDI